MYRTIDRSDHGGKDFTKCTKTGDKTRVNSEGGALLPSPPLSLSPAL